VGKSSPKQEVTDYYMSIHFGICAGADAIKRIIIKEKDAWTGSISTLSTIPISKRDLFGGNKKEGGVEGTVHWLPGNADQVLPDELAQKLGRSGGTDAPGFRGLASAFFVGSSASKSGRGFLWSSNVPYLPGTWIEVERAPVGLNPVYALVPRAGTAASFTSVGIVDLSSTANGSTTAAGGISVGETISGFDPSDIIRVTLPTGQTWVAWSPWGEPEHTGVGSGSQNRFYVIPDGVADDMFMVGDQVFNTGSGAFGYDGYEAARAAFGTRTFTGGSEYHLFFLDDPVNDNSGGLSILVEHGIFEERDANPAHIIFECLTNTDWGMGSPETMIDKPGFEDIAEILYSEGFGLSMIWTRQASIQDFIQEVLDHIQAVLYVDPATGLLTLKLIRGDYDEGTLPELTPSNATLSNFGRKLWGEIVNEIVVTWTNPENEQEETVIAHDLASITTQGGIISDGRNYYGVRNAALAKKLADRDLRTSGAPLATCEAEVNRTQWQLRPASVLKVIWPEYGLSGVVMRVTGIDYGKPGDPTIKVSLVEDVFGLDAADYVAPPSSGWEDPSSDPAPADIERVFTLPLYMAASSTAGGDIGSATYPEVLAGLLVTTADDDTFEYELWDEVTQPDGSTAWSRLTTNNILGHGELDALLPAEAVSSGLTFANGIGDVEPTQGGFVIIGDGTEEENEIAMITAAGVTYTLARGVLDTVPKAWPAGTPVWFLDGSTIYEDPTTRSAGEVVSYKVLTRTSQGLLDLSDASLLSHTLTERPWLPNRPANVQVDGVSFNTAATPVDMTDRSDPWVTISWANRNRLTEDSQVLAWTAATVTPETGQTTKIEVYASDGTTLLTSHDGLAGTDFDVPDASFGSESVVLLKAVGERSDADGDFVSLQAHGIWVQVGGARVTEDGEFRITEDGELRATED
jgi:hypothetical protein